MEAAEEHRPLEIGSKTDAFMTAVNSSSLVIGFEKSVWFVFVFLVVLSQK